MFGQILGSLVNAGTNMYNAREDRKLQEKAAKNSIKWRVEDAKRAGIHPLYAIGAPPFSPAAVSVSGDPGAALASAVQGLGQAFDHEARAKAQMEEYQAKERASVEDATSLAIMGKAKADEAASKIDLEEKMFDLQLRRQLVQKGFNPKAPKGSKQNPHDFRVYYWDDVKKKYWIGPHENWAESYDNMVGRGAGLWLENTDPATSSNRNYHDPQVDGP